MTDSHANRSIPNEFRIAGTPNAQVLGLFVAVVSVVGLVLLLAWSVAGGPGIVPSLLAGLAVIGIASVTAWRISSYGQGVVKLTLYGITVETPVDTKEFRWDHIADIDQDEGGAATRFRHAPHIPSPGIVRIRLTRSLRLGFHPRRGGTDVPGIPSLGAKVVRLQIEDAQGFLTAARQYMEMASAKGARGGSVSSPPS